MFAVFCKCLGFSALVWVFWRFFGFSGSLLHFWKCFGFLEVFTVVWAICGLQCLRFSECLLGFLKVLFWRSVEFRGCALGFLKKGWDFWACFGSFGSV